MSQLESFSVLRADAPEPLHETASLAAELAAGKSGREQIFRLLKLRKR